MTITYDADGDTTQIQDANTNYQYTYNADDEVSTFANNGTTGLPLVTLTYAYDGDSNETSVGDSLGGLLTLTYDARDELTNEQFSGTGLSAEAVTYAYDNAGRLTGLTRYSNLTETTVVAATAYSYDHANRMTGIVDSNSTGTTLVSYGYTYDAADRISQETRTWASSASSDTLTYTYTNNNQLTGVSHTNGSFANESFPWDANGNETGTGYTTTTDNEQTASPGYTYAYDNAGEMTSETQTSTGDVWTFGYDFRGRMVTAVEKSSAGTTLESVTYTYDALDNRIGMDENGTQTWTLYDSGTPIMDFNGSGSLTMRYLWGPTGIVARQTSGGTVSWYLADQLGTVRDLINNSGAIIDHVDFSAFGTVIAETSPMNGDRMMGFAGMERDTITGLNLAVFREENPGTGRWDSQDPLGFGGMDPNLYRAVGNDPTDRSDPGGKLSQTTRQLPNLPDNVFALDPDQQLLYDAIQYLKTLFTKMKGAKKETLDLMGQIFTQLQQDFWSGRIRFDKLPGRRATSRPDGIIVSDVYRGNLVVTALALIHEANHRRCTTTRKVTNSKKEEIQSWVVEVMFYMLLPEEDKQDETLNALENLLKFGGVAAVRKWLQEHGALDDLPEDPVPLPQERAK